MSSSDLSLNYPCKPLFDKKCGRYSRFSSLKAVKFSQLTPLQEIRKSL